MRILTVEFERLRYTKEQPNHCRFVAETDEAFPHGDKGFSGILLRDGLRWKARADVSTTWSKPGGTRKQAVKNCVDEAIKSFAEFEAARLRQDAEDKRRRQHLAKLNEQLRQNICANANRHRMEKPATNNAMFNGLSKKEIELFFGVAVESDARTAEAQSEQRRGRDMGIYGSIVAYHSRKEQPPTEEPPTKTYTSKAEASSWAERDPRTGEKLPEKDIPRSPYIPLALRK